MEVHQHTHSPKKRWTHYLWEFLMLFLAVFCGFLAENFREHSVEHKRASVYVRQLLQEIEPDTARIDSTLEFLNKKESIVDSLIYYVKSGSPSSWKNINYYLATLDIYDVPTFHKSAFDQIKNSGSLRFFSKNLTEAIQEYSNSIAQVESYLDYIFRFFDQRLTPFLAANFDLEFSYVIRNSGMNRHYFDSVWENSIKPSGLLSEKKNALTEFKNNLFEVKSSLGIRNAYTDYIRCAEKLMVQIKKEYHIE